MHATKKSMFNTLTFALGATAALTACEQSSKQSSAPENPAIYNEDNRSDLYQVDQSSLLAQAARSTLIMVPKSKISSTAAASGSLPVTIAGQSFGTSYGLCPSEKFFDQPTVGKCSVFLVAPDIIATAGHCLTTKSDCDSSAFVLDFAKETSEQDPLLTTSDKVFYCKSILTRTQNALGPDFALARLDRAVVGRTPLKFNAQNSIPTGTPIGMVGYPSGLPLKVTANATVRNSSNISYFVTDLDAFGGNSGSAVLNMSSGLVEGVLVRGVTDFVDEGGCKVSKICTGTECKGEEVTKSHLVNTALSVYQVTGQGVGGSGTSTGSTGGSAQDRFKSIIETVRAKLKNCSISLVPGSVQTAEGSQNVSFDVNVQSTTTMKSETLSVSSDNTDKSLVTSILSALIVSTMRQCFLN